MIKQPVIEPAVGKRITRLDDGVGSLTQGQWIPGTISEVKRGKKGYKFVFDDVWVDTWLIFLPNFFGKCQLHINNMIITFQ